MGNCLVTKLKGAVNNPDLVKLGHYRVIMRGGGTSNRLISDVQTVVDLVSGNAKIYSNEGNELSFPCICASGVFYKIQSTDGNEFVIDVDNKYTTQYVGYWLQFGKNNGFTLEDFNYFPNVTILAGYDNVPGFYVHFDEEAAANKSYPRYIEVDLRNGYSNGNIANIPIVLPNIERVTIYVSNTRGSIEDMVRAFRNLGRTTSSLKFSGWVRNGNITFNNHTLADTSYDDCTISWTPTTMTLTKADTTEETINA